MPLEDALSLVDRDFDRYCQSVREGRIPPRKPKDDISHLLQKAASGESLSKDQLSAVIDSLQKQQNSSSSGRPPEPG